MINFSVWNNYLLIEVETDGRIDFLIHDYIWRSSRTVQLKVPDDVGETFYGGPYYDQLCAFSDGLFLLKFGPEVPGKIQIFRYEPGLDENAWQIKSVHTNTFPLLNRLRYLSVSSSSSQKIIFNTYGAEEERKNYYIYDGELECWEVKGREDVLEAWWCPETFRRTFRIDKAATEKGRFPIYAIDVQPRTLKALALDSLLNSSPELSNRHPLLLKSIGIPSLIVDEITKHKALEADADSVPVFELTEL